MKNFDRKMMKLYLVTDSTGLSEEVFLEKVRDALEGGVTLIQLREKNKTTREYMELATRVHDITKEFGVPLIIDDRIDVAMAIGAEGVHLGQSDMPIDIARKIVGDDMIIGATTKTVPQALEAYKTGQIILELALFTPQPPRLRQCSHQ